MMTELGISSTWYALLTWFAGSSNTGKLTGLRASSSFTGGASLSTFTPMSVKPAGLYFLYIWSSKGISCWQGPHQVAQKFNITTWPLYWLKPDCSPLSAVSVNAGAGPPASEAKAVNARTMAAIAQRVKILTVELCIDLSYENRRNLEKYRQAQCAFYVVNVLVDSE